MSVHQDGVIEAARKIDTMVHGSSDRNSVINDVNNYLSQNPTLVSDADRSKAFSQLLTAKGDLPDLMVGEYKQAAVDQSSDPLTKLLAQQTVLGSSDGEIQKNAKTLTEGLAAREGLYAFDNDRWNQIFSKVTTKDQQSASVSHDDIKNALKDSSLNLTTDERKALTDIDENFNKLRHHWRLDSVSHTVDLEQLQYDLDKKDDGKRGWLLASVDALQGQAQSAAKDGNVTVNIESGEGWQNVAAKALGYDIRLRTKDDWSAVPQTDINTIYGLANYFKQNAGITMLHPGQLQLQVPEQFQTS